MNTRQIAFLVFCLMLTVASVLLIGHYGSANQLFTGAYSPAVEQYQVNHSEETKPARQSNEPYPGIRESDIKKYRGNRYSTY